VRLGEHKKSSPRDCLIEDGEEILCADEVQDILIDSSDFIVHENYNHTSKKNDIALIRLKESAKIEQNNIKPICMPFDGEKDIKIMTVIGFGATEKSGRANSDVLMKVNVELKENEECTIQLKLPQYRSLDETQICAGGELKFIEKEIF
jgi:secreted trypsin-like serine protease